MAIKNCKFMGTRPRLTPEEKLKIVRLYTRELLTLKVLSLRFGVSTKSVSDVLREANAQKPSRNLAVV